MVSPEDQPEERRDDHLANVVNEESHEKRRLLSVVVCNETDGLHVLTPALTHDHGQEEFPTVFLEALHDRAFIDGMEHNMLFNDLCLLKHTDIKFFCV